MNELLDPHQRSLKGLGITVKKKKLFESLSYAQKLNSSAFIV
jgi:hypothetical protein